MKTSMTRRQVLFRALAGLTVVAAGGTVWRAWDNGVFAVGEGPAYEPWHSWRDDAASGPLALVQAGILASNAHNTQPWRFRITEDAIALHADHERHLGSFDPFRRELMLSLGCVLENMAHAARAQGFQAEIEMRTGRLTLDRPGSAEPVAIVRLTPADASESALFNAIPHRHTHRGAYDIDRPVPATLQDEMQALVLGGQALRLFLLGTGAEKDRLGQLIVASTESIIADHQMAMDSARWFRFDWRSIQEHRDGVTLDAVGLPPLVNAVAKIVPAPSPEVADRQWLDGTRDVHVATAPLLGMIAVRDLYDQPAALEAGRLWQRLHLWATVRGLSAQPLNQPPEMVDREAELDVPSRTAGELAALTGDPAWRPTFIFRMGYSGQTARLSPRRSLEQVVFT